MKKRILSLAFVAVAATVFAQSTTPTGKVGVNTDAPKETLEVSGTMKVADLPTAGVNKIYNGAATKTGTFTPTKQVVADANGVFGTQDLEKTWFYMPSIVLPLASADVTGHPYSTEISNTGSAFTIDLHEIYKKQFTPTNMVSTASATSPKVYAKNEVDIFVVYYDTKVFENVSFDANKNLKYTVKAGAVATEHTYINVVFRVK